MVKAVVVGNGESRCRTNLELYRTTHTIIGCNALHRDIAVDHLICCDRRMVAEALLNPQTKNTLIYVRPDWFYVFRKIQKNKNIKVLPELPYTGRLKCDDPDHWGSGGFAVLLAAVLNFDEVELIGFDLYPVDRSVNNVYKGTENYAGVTGQAVDPAYWIYQIGQVFKFYPDIKFVVRNRINWTMPTEWQKNNVKFIAL
jgi:hypothetical protein